MHIPPLKPEVLFNLGPLPITNSFLTSILAALLLCIFAIIVGTNFKRLPRACSISLRLYTRCLITWRPKRWANRAANSPRSWQPSSYSLFLITGSEFCPGSVHWASLKKSIMLRRLALQKHLLQDQLRHPQLLRPRPTAETTGGHEVEFTPLFRGGNADLNMTFALALSAWW